MSRLASGSRSLSKPANVSRFCPRIIASSAGIQVTVLESVVASASTASASTSCQGNGGSAHSRSYWTTPLTTVVRTFDGKNQTMINAKSTRSVSPHTRSPTDLLRLPSPTLRRWPDIRNDGRRVPVGLASAMNVVPFITGLGRGTPGSCGTGYRGDRATGESGNRSAPLLCGLILVSVTSYRIEYNL